MMNRNCNFPGCKKEMTPSMNLYYDGKLYCSDHYRKVIQDEFLSLFQQWHEETAPPKRLVYLFGRLYDERRFKNIGGYLSAARIRDRGFDFTKTLNGTRFSITRHYNAWSDALFIERVVEIWDLDFNDEIAELINKRQWRKDDPE
jgi:hypothetical protein